MERDNSSATSGSGHSNPTTTKVITKRTISGPIAEIDPSVISSTKHEEWTTSKKKVNHKTKQVETRVQRQIILEDGKVIADSGPQVTTKTTEDNTTEETENTEHKTSGEPPEEGYAMVPGSAKVVSEKTETHQTMKETKEENMKLHDESFQELTGTEIHQKALISQDDMNFPIGPDGQRQLPGKLTHFSSRSQKVTDKEEMKEISELKDGELTTETTRTHHHEERFDDEIPEDEVDESALPEISNETTRKIEYYNEDDFDSLSDKLRKERQLNLRRETSPERKDPVTRRKLDFNQEEGIRNNETNRWLEDHFGSDGSDIVETTKTKSGGNVISIQMAPSRKLPPKDNHEHADDTITYRPRNNPPYPSERLIEKPLPKSSNFSSQQAFVSSQVDNINNSRSTFLSNYEKETKNKAFTDTYQTQPRKAFSPQPSSRNRNIYNSPKGKETNGHRSPMKTFYLGENGTYQPSFSKPLYHSTPLKKDSFLWKSSPSIPDDYARLHSDDKKIRKHDSFRYDNRSLSNTIQRSHSQRETNKKDSVEKTNSFSTSPFLNGHIRRENVSQTLPRDTKLHSKSRDTNHHSLFRSSYENLANYQDSRTSNNSRVIHVELVDEKDRGMSPSYLHRPEARESQTLPRLHTSLSPARDSTLSRSHTSSPYKSPRNFYFGDAADDKSYYNSLRKSTSGSSNHYQDGIKTSDSFTFTPHSRTYHPQERSPRNEIMGSRYHSNIEDSKNYYVSENNRSMDDTLIKSSFSQQVGSHQNENVETRNENYIQTFSTADNNIKNKHRDRRSADHSNGFHRYSHNNDNFVSSTSETKRHQFMKGLLDSSDRDCDVWISKAEGISSVKKSSAESRQRQPTTQNFHSPPVHLEIGRSKSPNYRFSQGNHLERNSRSPSPQHSPSFQPKGLLKTASFSKPRTESKGKFPNSAGVTSNVVNPPSFTPLSCPLEIKNMGSSNHRSALKSEERNHAKSFLNKPPSKTGPIMVEIRDWDSR